VGGTCVKQGRAEESFGGKVRRKKPLGRSRRNGKMGSEWILGRLAGGV
jgi:hypothetical protein